MKRISKSIATQLACRPRHVVASGESSQVKSGRRRSRLAPLASRALLAVHLHSACNVYLHCFAVHSHSACSTSPLCSSLLAMHLHFACSASLLCIYACSTSVPNTAQLAQRALLAVHLHSACSTSVPNSAELAMALLALPRYLSSLHHNHFSKSHCYIITNNPF